MALCALEQGMERVPRGRDVLIEHAAHEAQRLVVVLLGAFARAGADDAVVGELGGREALVVGHFGEQVDGALRRGVCAVRAGLDHGCEEGHVGDGVGDEARVAEEVPALSDEVGRRGGGKETLSDGRVGSE